MVSLASPVLLALLACGGDPPVEPSTPLTRPPIPIDADGDYFSPPEDCDDNNPEVLPTPQYAHLICDGIDNDCDGILEGEADRDGDGFGPCDTVRECDDRDPNTYLGAPDGLGDGVDQDCDGTDGVGLYGTPVLDGELANGALGLRMERADVNGDGCDDLVLANGGATNLSSEISSGATNSIRVLMGCGEDRIDYAAEFVYSGFGNRMAVWPRPGGDWIVLASPYEAAVGSLHVMDFSVDPPQQVSYFEGTENVEFYGLTTLQRGGEWYLALGELNTNFPSGPIRVYPLPLLDTPTLIEQHHEEWLPAQTEWQTSWKLWSFDRDGDGDDELFTHGRWHTPAEVRVGELYGLDGPGLIEDAVETWVGARTLGERFGASTVDAQNLRNTGEPWLLSGGVDLEVSGAMYALPPNGPGSFSALDSPIRFVGEFVDDWFGHDAAVGDVDGDGVTDVVVGAPGSNGRNDQRGKVYVFLGPFEDGGVYTREDAIVYVGERADDHFGMQVELVDLDGDGAVEVYVAAPPWNDPDNSQLSGVGRIYRLDLPE